MKYCLNRTLRMFKNYHYIAKDIIEKYELFNKDLKNNRILRSLWNLQISNNKMNDELTKIIQEKDITQRVNKTIRIYIQREENNEIIDNKKEDDEWWEEIQKLSINQMKNENNKMREKKKKVK